MALDPLAQGFEQSGETADPARHDRTVDLNAAAGVDAGLAMQRQMIAKLRHDDMGEQRRAWTPLLHRQRRHRRLDDGLAPPAAHLRPHVHDALEVGGNEFEHLALVRADPADPRALRRRRSGTARRVVDDRLRRQMVGQGSAVRRLALLLRRGGSVASAASDWGSGADCGRPITRIVSLSKISRRPDVVRRRLPATRIANR